MARPPTQREGVELEVRKGMASVKLTRDEFKQRFRAQFVDPAFEAVAGELAKIEAIAWDGYDQGRKSPRTRKAGPGFADPDYDLSVDWLAARDAIQRASALHKSSTQSRILVIAGAARNEHTCPGEASKTSRLVGEASEALRKAGCHVDLLDLSRATAEYGLNIHPCKGCVSTAMPLCHWPCSCYPNHGLGQTQDWMNDIYPLWVAAHGIMIVTPTYWYQSPSPLKLMLDRLVCADGGNPDPTSTHGKKAAQAKALEIAGWAYPRHLEGRAFGIVVHGDAAGTEAHRRALHDALVDMNLEPAGNHGEIDRYIGYLQPYATSHEDLDDDEAIFAETRNVAKTLCERVAQLRAGTPRTGQDVQDPRPK